MFTKMDAKGVLNGKFTYKVLGDGGIDRTKVICVYCKAEFAYYRSTSSLKYHLSAKHAADTESRAPAPTSQTTLVNLARRRLDKPATRKLSDAIAEWVATSCRPINVVEDDGLQKIIRIASNDWTYAVAARNPGRYANGAGAG